MIIISSANSTKVDLFNLDVILRYMYSSDTNTPCICLRIPRKFLFAIVGHIEEHKCPVLHKSNYRIVGSIYLRSSGFTSVTLSASERAKLHCYQKVHYIGWTTFIPYRFKVSAKASTHDKTKDNDSWDSKLSLNTLMHSQLACLRWI